MELDKRCAELLFQVLTEREEKTAVAIASNDSFSGREASRIGAVERDLHFSRYGPIIARTTDR